MRIHARLMLAIQNTILTSLAKYVAFIILGRESREQASAETALPK